MLLLRIYPERHQKRARKQAPRLISMTALQLLMVVPVCDYTLEFQIMFRYRKPS